MKKETLFLFCYYLNEYLNRNIEINKCKKYNRKVSGWCELLKKTYKVVFAINTNFFLLYRKTKSRISNPLPYRITHDIHSLAEPMHSS